MRLAQVGLGSGVGTFAEDVAGPRPYNFTSTPPEHPPRNRDPRRELKIRAGKKTPLMQPAREEDARHPLIANIGSRKHAVSGTSSPSACLLQQRADWSYFANSRSSMQSKIQAGTGGISRLHGRSAGADNRRCGAGGRYLCPYDTIRAMARPGILVFPALVVAAAVWPQTQEESFAIYTEHPRLLLGQRRLKLLRRERERQSLRWMQFEQLMAGKAVMPEPGLAKALYYRVSGDAETGRQAIGWALTPGADVRQVALVYDWCQDLLAPPQAKSLASILERALGAAALPANLTEARNRLFAAIALADTDPASKPIREIRRLLSEWWRDRVATAIRTGQASVPRNEIYPLLEILHAVRDNLNIDLRDSAPKFFKELPIYDLLSYYPAAYPAGENEFRIPSSTRIGEPDLRIAALARAADLSMVAYDVNSPESQYLQGWLMHDRYLMRGPLGISYEFLWANPYQPGLSFYHLPLVYHDELFGRLFLRSSWDEDASWVGYFDGRLQYFRDGKQGVIDPKPGSDPIRLPHAIVFFSRSGGKFRVTLEKEQVFILGLAPRRVFEVEVDQEEIHEQRSDPGGILPLDLPSGPVGFRVREAGRN